MNAHGDSVGADFSGWLVLVLIVAHAVLLAAWLWARRP